MLKAVILDVDGALVDTNYHHAIAWDRALARHDAFVPLWRIHRHIGMGGDQLVAELAGDDVERRSGEDIRDAESELYAGLISEVWDIEAAKRAEIESLAVLTGGFSESELRGAGAISVYESVVELIDDLDAALAR